MNHKYIYNKVKNLGISATVLMAGGMLTGCSDFLEIKPQNEIILEQFWNEEKDVENIVTGCYSGMQTYGMISRMMIWGEFRSENIVNNGTITDDTDLERLLKENITANNGYTNWAEFYGIINRCNTVIKYAPEVAEKDPAYTQSELQAHIAEVSAIRALCYFYLIRTFRDVPYSEEPFIDDNETLDIPATPFNQVLANLINNLESVAAYSLNKYPEKNTTAYWDYNCNRVTKSLIYSLLCEMYLWQKDYTNCIKYANLIIDQKRNNAKENGYTASEFEYLNGYPLISSRYKGANNYGNAFNQIFVANNSSESIFELNFRKDDNDGRQNCNGPVCFFYGGGTRVPFVKPSTYVSNDERDKLYNVYAAENEGYDGRAYENMRFDTGGSPTGINKYATRGTVNLSASTTPYKQVGTYGQLWPTYDNNKQSRNKANFIFYRLSDIMLLKAEAIAQMISSDANIMEGTSDYDLLLEAFDLVDAVNKRSLLESVPYKHVLDITNYTSKQKLTDLIYEERNRELMFEGKRYFDLVRRSMREGNTEYLSNRVTNKDAQTASVVKSKMQKMDAIFWPYNLYELKVNHHLKQNPAFGSGETGNYEKS